MRHTAQNEQGAELAENVLIHCTQENRNEFVWKGSLVGQDSRQTKT